MSTGDSNWPLVDPQDDGIRPAGPSDACFYCEQLVGTPHARDCVVVTKVARFRCKLDIDITVPHSWSPDQIRRCQLEHGFSEVWAIIFEGGDNGQDCLRDTHCEFVGIVDDAPRRELRITAESTNE
jgi:hypothetical protein